MATKKVTNVPKSPAAPGSSRSTDGKQAVSARRGEGAAAASAQSSSSQAQYEQFEDAIKLFNAQNFHDAREIFRKALSGPHRQIAYNAELHVRMCDRRLEKPALQLKTLEDHYNYAITQMNARNLDMARQHLETALQLDSRADHVYYALALCHGWGGDLQSAYENLKRAIELQPRNRIAAQQDADFAGIAHQPPLNRLLFPDKTHSS